MLSSWYMIPMGIIIFLSYAYIFSKWFHRNFYINIKVLIFGILLGLLYIILDYYSNVVIRSIIFNIALCFLIKNIYKESWTKTILGILFIFILFITSELVYCIAYAYIFKFNMEFITTNSIGIIVSNFIMIMLSVIFSFIIANLVKGIINWYSENKTVKLVLLTSVAFFVLEYLMYQNFVGINDIFYFIGANLFFAGILIFIVGFFKEKSRNNELFTKYDSLFNYVKTYEKISIDKSKKQHEYKNQLILIKEMIESNDKKSLKYVEKLLKIEDKNESSIFVDKLVNIPEGGLKGFILFKVDKMIEKGITVAINASPELSDKDLWENVDNELQDVSRAIGVYLDNAIEAAMEAERKFIIIDIDKIDNDLVFTFSNTYDNSVDISKIDKDGYSTKGKNRGHGLPLINDIISKNNRLEQIREINGIYYVQKLIVKNK